MIYVMHHLFKKNISHSYIELFYIFNELYIKLRITFYENISYIFTIWKKNDAANVILHLLFLIISQLNWITAHIRITTMTWRKAHFIKVFITAFLNLNKNVVIDNSEWPGIPIIRLFVNYSG